MLKIDKWKDITEYEFEKGHLLDNMDKEIVTKTTIG